MKFRMGLSGYAIKDWPSVECKPIEIEGWEWLRLVLHESQNWWRGGWTVSVRDLGLGLGYGDTEDEAIHNTIERLNKKWLIVRAHIEMGLKAKRQGQEAFDEWLKFSHKDET